MRCARPVGVGEESWQIELGLGLVGSGNISAMLFHDALANRQTQSSGVSVTFPLKLGLEDMIDLVRTNATPSMGEFHCDVRLTPSGKVFAAQSDSDTAGGGDRGWHSKPG